MRVDISIIIVNFNTCDLLKNCLDTIEKYSGGLRCETIVIDNDSRDGSQTMIRGEFPEVRLICNNDNAGFARANNQGIAEASGTYVFLLNPDTELFPGTLQSLKTFMDNNPGTGAVGPRTFLDHRKTLEVCTLKTLTPSRAVATFTRLPFPGRKRILQSIWELDHHLFLADTPIPVEGIGGAAFFTRKSFLNDINGLDEQFFMGYEDTDLAAAITRNNQTIHVLHDSHLLHLFGQAKKLPAAPDRITYDWQLAPAKFLKKYYGLRGSLTLKISKFVDSIWRRIFRSPTPAETYDSSRDLTLEWSGDSQSRYLFELSNDSPFIDKFATPVQGNTLVIPTELCRRLTPGIWFWRVWSINHSEITSLIHESRFILTHTRS